MKKTLFIAAMCGLSISAMAQMEHVKDLKVDMPEEVIDKYEYCSDNLEATELDAQEGLPVISIKRPGGFFFPGYQQNSSASLTVPYAKIPAYTNINWVLSKEDWSDNTAEGEFVMAVPFANTINDEESDWVTSEGDDITSMLLPMGSKFYPSPFASCVNDNGETVYTMVPPYIKSDGSVTNDAHLYAGGSQPASSTSGYQMSANYCAYWPGNLSYSTKYFGFNTTKSNDGWTAKGYENAKVKGFAETFAAPASPYMLMNLNWFFYVPADGHAGPLNLTIRKATLRESGSLASVGDLLATSRCEEPVMTSSTRALYNFNTLLDADGNELSFLPVDCAIVVEVSLDANDETTNMVALYKSSTVYNDGEYHAYTHISYDKEGAEANTMVSSNYRWTNSEGVASYQASFLCGLCIKYPYAKVLDAETGIPTKENVMEVAEAGGSQNFFVHAYYNYGAWKIYSEDGDIQIAYDSEAKEWTSSVDWIRVSTVSGQTEEGNYNGEVTLTIEVAANAGEERETTLYIDCYGYKEPIIVKQAGTPSGIAEVNNAKNNNGKTFNVAGQEVGRNYKGVVISNGVKTIRK